MKNLRSSYKCRIRDTLRNTPYGDVTELLPLMDVHEASCNNLFHGKLTGRSAFDTCPRLWPQSDVAAPLFSLVRPTRTDPYESLLHCLRCFQAAAHTRARTCVLCVVESSNPLLPQFVIEHNNCECFLSFVRMDVEPAASIDAVVDRGSFVCNVYRRTKCSTHS
jgi:hypothetical protein